MLLKKQVQWCKDYEHFVSANLEWIFDSLGFNVEIHNDLDAREMSVVSLTYQHFNLGHIFHLPKYLSITF